jgi:hypothetical protein
MSAILAAQIAEARLHYPSLRPHDNPQVFFLSFAPNLPFVVAFASDYPQSPPRVTVNKEEFRLPMTAAWRSFYTVLHLCQQLERVSRVPVPTTFKLAQNEIQSIPVARLQDPAQQDSLVRSLPSVARALQAASDASGPLDRLSNESAVLIDQCMQLVSQLEGMNAAMPQLNLTGNETPQAQEDLKQKIIQSLKTEVGKIDSQIRTVKDAFEDGKIDKAAFLEQIEKLCQDRASKAVLAKKLSEVFAWYAFGLDRRG